MTFDGLEWLLGEWKDDSRSGEPGQSTAGGESWQTELGGQILVRKSWCEYAATSDHAAFRHDDVLVVFHDYDAMMRAMFWDNHGHVIRYGTVSVDPDGKGFVFESDRSIPGPRQKLRYRNDGVGRLAANFNLQLPGAPAYTEYLQWRSSNVGAR